MYQTSGVTLAVLLVAGDGAAFASASAIRAPQDVTTIQVSVIGADCTVRDNIVHHVGYTGIAIQGVAGRTCTPLVRHIVCYRNMGGGIGSMQGSNAIIDGNVGFQNFYAGIGHERAPSLVVDDECYENIRAGIGSEDGAQPSATEWASS